MDTKFKPGQSGNPAGRPKGSTSRTTEELRGLIGELVYKNWDRVCKAIDNMDDEKAVMTIERLLRHYLPQLRDTTTRIDLKSLNEAELNQLIDEIINHYEKQN